MHTTLISLIERLQDSAISSTNVIKWGAPVPSFGDLSISRLATLGLNPSNREFVDKYGNELQGDLRRFHTLNSLGLDSWESIDVSHLRKILNSCRVYFQSNPYDQWFKRLDRIISSIDTSYYKEAKYSACHLDLIPYATFCKWTDLSKAQRSELIGITGDTLGLLLRNSPVEVIILNGKSVVNHFEYIAQVSLESREMLDWSLPRQGMNDVCGVAYIGKVDHIAGVMLGRQVKVLGYNHNIQSSFGVTNKVIDLISEWIAQVSMEEINETK